MDKLSRYFPLPSEEDFVPKGARILYVEGSKSATYFYGGATVLTFVAFGLVQGLNVLGLEHLVSSSFLIFSQALIFVTIMTAIMTAMHLVNFYRTGAKNIPHPKFYKKLYNNLKLYNTTMLIDMATNTQYTDETRMDIQDYLRYRGIEMPQEDFVVCVEEEKDGLFETIVENIQSLPNNPTQSS